MTLNDARRVAWLADLSNPSVPLSKLSRTVLHVTKGPDLLDMLHAHGVAIPRAVWYVRILGANESVRPPSRYFLLVVMTESTVAVYAEPTELQPRPTRDRMGRDCHFTSEETVAGHRIA